MRIDVLTLFPQLFEAPFSFGIFKRAIDEGLVKINLVNFRDYAHDRHHTVDDYPYGGGPGMVLKPEPLFEAVEALKSRMGTGPASVIMLTPQGRLFSQRIAGELAQCEWLVLICGHYEGVDERVREYLVSDELSIGDYVLTGGEIPALVVMDAVIRLIPGVLGSEASVLEDSHMRGLLEYPQYTRPPVFREWAVPEVLLSGDHARTDRWRRDEAIKRTLKRRPDLIQKACLEPEEQELVERLSALNSES